MNLYSEFADGFQFSEGKKTFLFFFFNKYRNYTFFMGHPLGHGQGLARITKKKRESSLFR